MPPILIVNNDLNNILPFVFTHSIAPVTEKPQTLHKEPYQIDWLKWDHWETKQSKWTTNLDKIKSLFSYLNFPVKLLWVVTVVPQCTEIIALDRL